MKATAEAGRRNTALDVAKGIAMVAVVTSHVMRGAKDDGVIAPGTAFYLADTFLYLFHVQLFLDISGYLGWPRASDVKVQRNRQLSLGYSYLLWSLLSLAALAIMHRPLPAGNPIQSITMLFYAPIQHFWFLPVIMIGYGVLAFLRTPLQLVVAILVCLSFRQITGFSYYGLDYYLVFFLVGALLRARPLPVRHVVPLAGLSAAAFLVGAFLCVQAGVVPPTVPLAIPISLAACYAVYQAAVFLGGTPFLGPGLAEIGRQSLPIYLTHVFFTAGTRDVLTHLWGTGPAAVILIASFAAGLLGPLFLRAVARRLGIGRLAGFEPVLR